MMLAQLIEKLIGSMDFSLSGENRKKQEHMERNQTGIFLIFILTMPKINLPFGDTFLEYSVDYFVEKRKTDMLQMPAFLLS